MGNLPSVILTSSLREQFASGWERCRVILFSAPCGCGKTTAAAELLRTQAVCGLNAADADFTPESLPSGVTAVLVDDLQCLRDEPRRQALCALIRRRTDLHFVLLGRGRLPGWLMPFQLSGLMLVIEAGSLFFDRTASAQLLAAHGISVLPAELSAIQRDFHGYPLSLELLCRRLAPGEPYSRQAFEACKRDLFVYYDEAVFHRFDPPLRTLLTDLAPFETFCLDLARMVSGEPLAGELLGVLVQDTSMLLFDGVGTYHFWPVFREFLLWEMDRTMPDAAQRALFSRAALCYELQGDLPHALDCYSRAGENEKISALLVKNAEQHPGVGHYRELQDYYLALPREEVLRSPSLMCGMSMLTAMCMDYEASEQWYRELQNYAAKLRRTDSECRDVRGKLAYLDIALPQRGSRGLIDVIGSVFRVMSDRELNVPAFSVTSTLPSIMNGGKDFCDWSRRDDLLYAAMRKPVETVLGRDGIGLADCAICESKFEKGEDVSRRLLTLMARLGDIQAHGTADIEFAVAGLLARVQVSQGKAGAALDSVVSLREKFVSSGQTRFLGNIDALLCRIQLRLGGTEAVRDWLEQSAPKNDARLWTMWRYQYLTRAMAQIASGEYDEPLLLLARLEPYCAACARVMDGIHIRLLKAICRFRRGDADWAEPMRAALDVCRDYSFLWPAAQYGAAILPLLRECGWNADPAFLGRLIAAARAQAVLYPRFLRPQPEPAESLSATETQVLKLLCENLSNQEIGEILDIKLPTVKTHVSHILQKLGVKRRAEVRQAAESLRLI